MSATPAQERIVHFCDHTRVGNVGIIWCPPGSSSRKRFRARYFSPLVRDPEKSFPTRRAAMDWFKLLSDRAAMLEDVV